MKNRSGFGWLQLILGVLLILLGIYSFGYPFNALTGVAVVYGILAIFTGVADIAFYVRMERRTGFGPAVSLISGIFSLLAGILILANPGAGRWALVLFFPIWFIAHCVSTLSHLTLIRLTAGTGYYYFTLIVNIIGILFGFMMLFDPLLSLNAGAWVIGFYLILLGVQSIALGISELGSRRRW